jgi:hypothetical protein
MHVKAVLKPPNLIYLFPHIPAMRVFAITSPSLAAATSFETGVSSSQVSDLKGREE